MTYSANNMCIDSIESDSVVSCKPSPLISGIFDANSDKLLKFALNVVVLECQSYYSGHVEDKHHGKFIGMVNNTFSNNSEVKGDVVQFEKTNDVDKLLDTMRGSGLFNKYSIKEVYAFYDDSEVWFVCDEFEGDSLSDFNTEMYGLTDEINPYMLTIYADKSEFDLDALPQCFVKYEV